MRVTCVFVVALMMTFPSVGAEDEEVVLYTNADLERFGPPSPAPDPAPAPDPGKQWSFVQRFLDREYQRLDADRRNELEWAALRVEEATDERRQRGYYGYGGYLLGYGTFGHHGRRGGKHAKRGSGVRYGKPGFPTVRERYFTRPTPIHARPRVGAPRGYRTGAVDGGGNRGGGRGGGGRAR